MQLEVILPLVAYLVVVFGISVYAMRKRSTGTFLNEYFLGSRSMGGIVLAMTLTATYISASSFIGGPGAAYKYGLGWVLLAMIQLPAVWLSLGILGKKFAILARRYNAVTLNDMLFARYQSRLLVWLASLSLLVAFVGAMTVQFIGGARLLETAAGIPYETGLLIFGISIALYTAFGGFRASVLNDTMQGLVMLIGTVVLLIGVVHAAGGLSNAVQTLQTIDPQLVTPQGADDILSPAFMTSFWVLVCFGVIGLPHTAVRCISYKDSKAVHRGMRMFWLTAVISGFIVLLTKHTVAFRKALSSQWRITYCSFCSTARPKTMPMPCTWRNIRLFTCTVAGYMTTLAADFHATRQTGSGWYLILKKCCTTTPCFCWRTAKLLA